MFEKKDICMIVGTRPNFIKLYPLYYSLLNATGSKINNKNNHLYNVKVIHTGQHYDKDMSDIFLDSLFNINYISPNFTLSSDINIQTCQIIDFLNQNIGKPSLVIVFGDVRSSFIASIVAYNLNLPIAHVEAGLRCFNNDMPEEINRKIIDIYSKYYFTTEQIAIDNLLHENLIKSEDINKTCFNVGNTMIDTLVKYKHIFSTHTFTCNKNVPLKFNDYILVTVHRKSNVDNDNNFHIIINSLIKLSEKYKIVFPVHPRTKNKLLQFQKFNDNIILLNPVGYLDFMSLMYNSAILLCDSAGQSEESSYLGIYCITLRKETERPITCTLGTNILVNEFTTDNIINLVNKYYGKRNNNTNIDLWDGKTSNRITNHIENILFSS